MEWLWYILVPFLFSLVLTPILKKIAKIIETYAQQNKRTIHKSQIPVLGGVAIYVSFMLCMALFMHTDDTINGIVLGGSIIFFVGLLDDFIDLKPIYKLIFQFIAALVLIYYGNVYLDVIKLPFGIRIDTQWICMLVTLFWIVGITNALNLLDGLDGLAGGISCIILVIVALISILEGRLDIQLLSFLLMGATLGVLIYNCYPASIFIGDNGSMFLGFIIASISLLGFKSSSVVTLALPILLLAVPIIDTISAVLRRKLNGSKMSNADRGHLHHVLMQRIGHRNAVLVLYVATTLFGFCAYAYLYNEVIGLALLFIVGLVIELFIEYSGLISKQFHPLIGLSKRIFRQLMNLIHFNKKKEQK